MEERIEEAARTFFVLWAGSNTPAVLMGPHVLEQVGWIGPYIPPLYQALVYAYLMDPIRWRLLSKDLIEAVINRQDRVKYLDNLRSIEFLRNGSQANTPLINEALLSLEILADKEAALIGAYVHTLPALAPQDTTLVKSLIKKIVKEYRDREDQQIWATHSIYTSNT